MKEYYGVIQKVGTVIQESGEVHHLPDRGIDNEGFLKVLIDARAVGGKGFFQKQSVKPFIGMKCSFVRNGTSNPYNHTIINEEK